MSRSKSSLKRLVVITLEEEAKLRYTAELRSFFKGYLDVEGYSVKEPLEEEIRGDLIVISSPIANDFVKPYLPENVEIIYLTRTFLKGKLEELEQLPPGSRAMFVDYCRISSVEIISLLYEKGIGNVELTPVYPDMEPEQIPDLDLAITAGLLSYVPPRAKRVIDLGWTVIDLSTLMEITTKLLIFDTELERRLFSHASRILPIGQGLVYALRSGSEIRNQWDVVLKVIDDGVMVIDRDERLLHINESMKRILDLEPIDFYRAELGQVIPYDELAGCLRGAALLENELIRIPRIEKSILVTKRRIKAAGFIYGVIIIVKDVTEIERLENQLRKQLSDRGHIARYDFRDIIGESQVIRHTIQQAKKLAQIDANILITGESGTGKELFTQSIHNASKRAKGPFIAINCASLVRELLESELFGYEEGAFTNARKGGKKGLFELAHNGTVFLDEIGEIPGDIQAKLLRFLQEKEVMRIGGTTTIPVNVRVIAATNRNLHRLMKEGLFRKDLYYRLTVFSLHLPALSHRRGDVPILIDHMLKMKNTPKEISPELLRFLEEWPWEGNIRELTNCVEYMSYMGGPILTLEDLPPTFTAFSEDVALSDQEDDILRELDGESRETAQRVLYILNRKNMGRRGLHQTLLSEGGDVSEYEIRQILDLFHRNGLIESGTGRSGTSLTEKGKSFHYALKG